MSVSMYQISVPVFSRMITNLITILDKAEAHCTAKKIDPDYLTNDRLQADMFPLKRQVQLVSDFARGGSCRLAGIENPKWEDTEKTFPELKARLTKTLEFLATIKPAQVDGSESRDVTLPIGGKPTTLKGQTYLMTHAFPHFFFHIATAYNILRHNGVEVGKGDYMGKFG